MIYIRIDPGLKGAISSIDSNGKLLSNDPMPLKENRELDIKIIKTLLNKPDAKIGIEQQMMFAQQGMSSGQKTVRNFGVLLGTLECLECDYKIFNSRAWKKIFPELETQEIVDLRTIGNDKTKPKPIRSAAKKKIKPLAKKAAIAYVNKKYGLKLKATQDGLAESIMMAIFIKESWDSITKD